LVDMSRCTGKLVRLFCSSTLRRLNPSAVGYLKKLLMEAIKKISIDLRKTTKLWSRKSNKPQDFLITKKTLNEKEK